MAQSAIKLSRFTKIAALTAVGGTFYVLRDEIKSYLNPSTTLDVHNQIPQSQDTKIEHKIIEKLPSKVPYLLVGAGTASHSAMRAIRGHDPKAKVLMIGGENHSPYMRPALSKELWFSDKELRRDLQFRWWNGKERSIFYEIDEFFIPVEQLEARETGGVSLVKNLRLTHLDPDQKIAYLENGQTVEYDKCLLAPGGRPKTLTQFEKVSTNIKDRIIHFRTADDFLRLEKVAESAKSILIIGGGLLGSELTCALCKRQDEEKNPSVQKIYQIYPEAGNLGKILPEYLSQHLSKKIEHEGAQIIPKCEVKEVNEAADKTIVVTLTNGVVLHVDYIVCAVGLEPDVELAKASNLEVDEKTGGFLVNSELEARTDVWVAGDASCFYDIKLGRRRVEHHDHAINSGRQAGQNMVGEGKPYTHQSMFWSDIGNEISFEAVGIIDSSLETAAVFANPEELAKIPEKDSTDTDPAPDQGKDNIKETIRTSEELDKFSRGVVFYLKNDVIVGVLLWNMFSRLNIARRILNEQKKYDDINEVAKLFNIYLDD